VYDLVEHMKPTPGANSKSAKKRPTVSSQFRVGFLLRLPSCVLQYNYFFCEGYIIFYCFSLLYVLFCFFNSDFADIIDDDSQSSTSLFCEMHQAQRIKGILTSGRKVYVGCVGFVSHVANISLLFVDNDSQF
jgi:hypothetical protein